MTEKHELLRDELHEQIKKAYPYFQVKPIIEFFDSKRINEINELILMSLPEECMILMRMGYVEPFIYNRIGELLIRSSLAGLASKYLESRKDPKPDRYLPILLREIEDMRELIRKYLDGKYNRITD